MSLITNLVATWNFDDDTGDDSVGSANGTVTDLTYATVDGITYAEADGSGNKMDLGTPAALDLGTSDFTISGWANMDSIPTGASGAALYNKGMTSTSSPAYDGTQISFFQGNARFFVGGQGSYTVITEPMSTGQWYHFMGTRSGTTMKFYVNGVLVDTKDTGTVKDVTSSLNGTIFSNYNGSWYTDVFDGKLADIRIWSRALSDGEAASVHTTGPETGALSLTDGLVFKAALSEDDDDSIQPIDGTSSNVSFIQDEGHYAMDFTAANAIVQFGNDAAQGGAVLGTSDFTISAWVKPTGTQSPGAVILGQTITSSSSPKYNGVQLRLNGTNLECVIGSQNLFESPVSSAISFDVWHHVMATREGTSIKLYIDGVLVDSGTTSQVMDTSSSFAGHILSMGGTSNGSAAFYGYNGYIDDGRMWKRALSGAEALSVFNTGAATPPLADSLVAKYPLDSDGVPSVGDVTFTASNVTYGAGESFSTFASQNSGYYVNSPYLDLADEYTLSFWFMNLKSRAAAPYGFLMAAAYNKETGGVGGYNNWDHTTSYDVVIYTNDMLGAYGHANASAGASTLNSTGYQMTQALYNGTGWHHMACAFSGGQMTYYINGVQVGVPVSTTGMDKLQTIGSYTDMNYAAFEYMDDFRVYNKAISAADAVALHEEGAEAPAAPAAPTIDLSVAQFDSYGDSWNGGSITIADANGVAVLTSNGPGSGVKAPAGLTETVSVEEGVYTYTIAPGGYPNEISATITDQYGTLLANLVGGSGTGTFTVSMPVSVITPVLSASGGDITVSATLNTEAITAGATQWAYSLSALGAVGQPHGGTLVALNGSATVTPASLGMHTVYVAAVDAAGNVVVDNSDTIDNSPSVSVTIVKTDSYNDGWDGSTCVITHVGTGNVLHNETLASGVSPETILLDLPYGDYTWALVGGSYIGEHSLSITLTSDGSVLATSAASTPLSGTFTVAAPAAAITPSTSVSGAAITVSATVNAVATAEGAANWSASLTGFGAVGATIDGAKALTAIGVDAALTAPSSGTHTVYAAVVDGSGVILAKSSVNASVFISQLSVGDDIIIMSYLEHPSLVPAGTHDQLTDDDGDLKYGPIYIGDLTIKSLSINSADSDEIVTDVTFEDPNGGDLDLDALVIELIKKYNLNLLSGVQASDGAVFQSVVDGTAGFSASALLSWNAEDTNTTMLPSGGGHYAEYDAVFYGNQISEVPPGAGSTAGPNGNSFVGIIEPGEFAPEQDSGSSSNVDARNLPSTSVSGNQVARWLFEDDYTDDASGGSAFEFGVVGSPSFVDGKHAGTKAVQIDQGDYFTFPSTLSAASVTGWSFALWVKEDGNGTQTSGPYGYEGNFMTDSTAVGQSHTGLNLPHANSYTMWDCDSVNAGGSQRLSTNAITFAHFTDWVHVVATKDKASGLMKLYKNGVLVSSGTRIANLPSITTAFKFGYGWAGIIDSIEIYNIALSDAEALEVYDASAPQASSYNWTHGQLSNIVKYVNGYDAASNRSHMYLKNDGGDTVVYFTPDLETWSSFGTYDVGAHSIEGAPVCAAYGAGGRVLIGTSTGCVYLVQLNEVSVPTSFTKVHDNGGMRINQVHFGVTSDAWLLEYDEKVYTMPAEGGALSLRMSIPAGSFVQDFSQADDATCIIIRKSDFSFATYVALPGWATIHDESAMRAIFTSLGVSNIDYDYALDQWSAADSSYNVISTDQIVDWLMS